jgi:hypothetical protein
MDSLMTYLRQPGTIKALEEQVDMTVSALRNSRVLLFAGLASLFLMISAATTSAESQSTVISRGFGTKGGGIVQAALVSTVSDSSNTVELSTLKNANRLSGVVSKTSLVELSQDKTKQVQVALSGTAYALVSDINGTIRAGDKITISPINGVGMLTTTDAQIVGTAGTAFTGKDAKTMTVKDKGGKPHTVHVGAIPIQISIAYYVVPTSKLLPPFLQNLANNVAGRPVSVARILLGSVLLLLAFVSIFALIYTSVKAGLISLGRNPLAAGAIQRSLVGVAITTLLIFAFSLLATYLILIY